MFAGERNVLAGACFLFAGGRIILNGQRIVVAGACFLFAGGRNVLAGGSFILSSDSFIFCYQKYLPDTVAVTQI